MSKEEVLKIQTCVLKVNIHCDGCENKVRKILQKIEGVYKTSINSEQGKVTVSGNIDPATLIKKLSKSGKHAELWGTPKANNNNIINNFKIDSGKSANNKNQKGNNGNTHGNNNNQQKGAQNQQQQMKGFQGLNLPQQFKALNLPFGKDQKQTKKVRFEDDDDLSDDEFDDYDDDDLDDDVAHHGKGKPGQMANNTKGMMMNGQAKGGGSGGNSGGNGKKSGGGNAPAKGNDGNNGKKGGGGGNQNQGGGGKGGNGNNGNNNGNGGKKAGNGMNNGFQSMPNMGQMKPMGQMGNFPMGQFPAVQGLPAAGMGPGGGGYYGGAGPEGPYYQQQLAAAMMSQQRAQGNEMFQPMMYSRPPPAVSYMPPYYSYQPPSDPYTHAFSDENTSSCSVM